MAKRKHSMAKATIFITIIVTMNIVGISYGYWQEGLKSEIQIRTGNIATDFYQKVKLKKSGDLRKSRAVLKIDKETDRKLVKVSGEIESGRRGRLTLDYRVINTGSIPIEFDEDGFQEQNQQLLINESDGLKILNYKSSEGILYPDDQNLSSKDSKGSLTLQIDAPEAEGEYEFEIKIPYKQWTGK